MTRPNVLFLFPDQWRGDWFPGVQSLYGSPSLQLPNLERLLERGTQFSQCRSNSPLCVPARACLAQGKRYGNTGVWDNPDTPDPFRPNFLHTLRAAGYQTLSAGKCDLLGHKKYYANSGWSPELGQLGFTKTINQRGKLNSARPQDPRPCPYVAHLRRHDLLETHRQDYAKRHETGDHGQKAPFPTPLPRKHYTDDFCGRSALDLLQDASPDGPWFLWVNFPGPHDPHDAPRELQQRYDDAIMPDPHKGEDGVEHQQLRRNYAAAMSGIDDWCGRLIDAVEQRGERDNTLIIFASDHGEMMGDHSRWAKSTWREPSVHVPFIAAGPGIPAGARDDSLVELIDIAALIQDVTGIDPVPDWDARNPLSNPRSIQHSALISPSRENQGWNMVTDGRWKYVEEDGEKLLFDLQADPLEDYNVAADNPVETKRLQPLLPTLEP
jgi:arylsulfatase A-like enzyme